MYARLCVHPKNSLESNFDALSKGPIDKTINQGPLFVYIII